jgi:hypothetical protein
MLFLYVCLGWTEQYLLDFALSHTVTNASVTTLHREEGLWVLDRFADNSHLVAEGAPVTEHAGDKDVDIH